MVSELIFITGATGFIGSHVVNYALRAGYRVRLSIRRKEQEGHIRAWLEDRQHQAQFAHIPDLTIPGAFKEALRGVCYIFHLASPLPGKGEDVRKDYVEPAVNGTMAILHEAKNHESVKFVIVASSILALLPMGGIRRPPVTPRANTGERLKVDLNRPFPEGFAGDGMKYAASKILAHQASRDFIQLEQPHFKLVMFHPVFVIGDSIVQGSFNNIDGMNKQLWDSLGSEQPLIPSAFVHVRDVAEAHIKALQNYQALTTGTEFILSTQPYGWNNVAKVIRKHYPQVQVKLAKGPFPQDDWLVDTSPADREIGMRWRSGEEMIRDVMDQQLALKANL